LLRPGHETHISIKAVMTSTTESLKDSLDPIKRNCFFKDEFYLSLFTNYSVNNCWMECLMNLSMMAMPKEDKCVPWNFPRMDGSSSMKPCTPRSRYTFLEKFRDVEMSKVVGAELCLPSCGGTTYEVTNSAAPFRRCDQANMALTLFCHLGTGLTTPKWGDHILKSYEMKNGSIPEYISNNIKSPSRLYPADRIFMNFVTREYQAYSDDIAVATFYFPSHVTTELVRSAKMTTLDYVSQIGGLLGLCLGFSLISLMEVVYWFTIGYYNKKQEAAEARRRLSNVIPIKY
jgi:amiloride-sensitive sodium channel